MPAYNDANFRLMFPAFADTTVWPEALLQTYWNMGTEFISVNDCPCRILSGDSLQLALDLMCAQIATLMNTNAGGKNSGAATGGGIVTNASVGAVSVGVMAPPVKDMWEYWLGQTPYGQQLLAMLKMKGVGGFYVGGLPERLGFRKVGGVFY
jgi:Protein of unknown function (DUF4054)